MKVKDILNFLSCRFPLDSACDFDNVGLLVGDGESEVKNVLVALDCTNETLNEAIKNNCQLIITHHPVIFEGVKEILADSLPYNLIKNGISVISMHTNLDIAKDGVSETLCKALELKNVAPFVADDGYTLWQGETRFDSAGDFALFVKEKLGGFVRFVDGKKEIKKVLVCSGSGGGFLTDVISGGFDALIAADIKHNVFMDAVNNGVTVFDAGHYQSENIIVNPLCQELKTAFCDIEFTTFNNDKIKSI